MLKRLFCIFVFAVLLCSCSKAEKPIEISFNKTAGEYYLFDDNPEYLRPEYTADGEKPSSIAAFDELGEGTYTVFSYHHRGTSRKIEEELYFDFLFSSKDAVVEIEKFCMDANWQWHRAWADYSGIPVEKPLYYETAKCTCASKNGKHKNSCSAICGGERFEPLETAGIGVPMKVCGNVLLSDMLERIKTDNLNKFRNTSNVDPMWFMMKFKVVSGTVSASTVCYSDAEAAKNNFSIMKKGEFFNEVQYKGIADCAPEVTADISYTFGKHRGAIPVKVKNLRVEEGYVCEDGRFATSINTYREKLPIAAESDMMCLEYKDESKTALYGKNEAGDEVWHFTPTKSR